MARTAARRARGAASPASSRAAATLPEPRELGRTGLRLVAVLCLALAAASAVLGPRLVRRLGGAWDPAPFELAALSSGARALAEAALAGIDPQRALDLHVHVVGVGTGGSGCWLNPRQLSAWHPFDRVRFEIYASAAGIDDRARADQRYFERLLALAESSPLAGRYLLLPFDYRYTDGAPDLERSEVFVPDAYARELAARAPERFLAAISVHPARPDALAALREGAAAGARVVKWLPNAMGIDPADPRWNDYYDEMRALGLALLSHGGSEQAVRAGADQELGNPLRLRAALDRGVRVIVAHCASSGESLDLDDPGRPKRASFELFLRMLGEARYAGLLYGEISTVTQVNRFPRVLATLLERGDLHARLVNGSDYPLPAVNLLYHTGALERAGFLTRAEREALDELYSAHPLFFDFALKRSVHHPETGARFAAAVFELPSELALVPEPR